MKRFPDSWTRVCGLLSGVVLATLATGWQFAQAQMPTEWSNQYADLESSLNNRNHFQQVAATTYRHEALILAEDRDPADVVLRRTTALLEHLRTTASDGSTGITRPGTGPTPRATATHRSGGSRSASRAVRRRLPGAAIDRLFQSAVGFPARSCSSSGTGPCTTTCAISTTAWRPRPAAGCTSCPMRSDLIRKCATCWNTRL